MKRIQTELDKLYFSDAQKEKLTQQLLFKRGSGQRKNSPLSHRLVATMVLLSFIIGAMGAVCLSGISPQFLLLFGISNELQAENLGALSVEEIFKDANGSGAFISVKELVADRERLYILMEFAAPQGVALPKADVSGTDHHYWSLNRGSTASIPEFFAEKKCTEPVSVYGGYAFETHALPDDDVEDNRILLLYTITTDRGFSDQVQYCKIPNISSVCTVVDGKTVTVLDDLDINITIPMGSATKSYSFYGRCGVNLGGNTLAMVDNLSISPISISFDLILADSTPYDKIVDRLGKWPVYVLLRDGTKIYAQWPERGNGRVDEFHRQDGSVFFRADHILLTLDSPIDMGEIVDIVFVGDNDPVDEQSNTPGKIVHFMFTPRNFFNNIYWNKVNKMWAQVKG